MTTRTLRTPVLRGVAVSAAAALLCGVTGAGTAAAQSTEPVVVKASSDTGVVRLVLTLPAAAPGLPNPIELTLLGTDGTTERATGGEDVARANSYLAGGSLVDDSPLSPVLTPLSRTITADLAAPGPETATGIALPDNPLGLKVTAGAQRAAVAAATRGNSASSELADASLGSLDALGLGAVLDPVLGGLNTALSTLVENAEPLTTAVGGLPSLPSIDVPNPLAPVVGGPATIPTPTLGGPAVAGTINELPARVQALSDQLQNGALVSLSGLDTAQSIAPTATSAVATGSSALADVSLFGGLVTVKATEATASVTAALTRSAADSTASATLVEVTIADSFGELLTAVASDKGITAGLLDGELGMALDPTVRPTIAAVDTALDALLAQLTALLEALGGGAQLIRQGTTSTSVSEDGRTATASASPALVSLGLPVAPNLVSLAIGAVDVSATVAPVTQALPRVPVETVPQSLPRTGAEAAGPVAALVLLLGAGGAVWLRRRTA